MLTVKLLASLPVSKLEIKKLLMFFVSNVPSHGGLNAFPNFVCVVHFMLSGNIFLSSLGLIRLLLAEFVAQLYSKVCVKDLLAP